MVRGNYAVFMTLKIQTDNRTPSGSGRASLPLTNTNTVSSEESEAFTRVICQAHKIGCGSSVTAGLLQPGQPFEMLEPYDPGQPGSRKVLMGRSRRKPRDLPDSIPVFFFASGVQPKGGEPLPY